MVVSPHETNAKLTLPQSNMETPERTLWTTCFHLQRPIGGVQLQVILNSQTMI